MALHWMLARRGRGAQLVIAVLPGAARGGLDDLHADRLGRARERYGRRVEPLDDDPLAFFAFVRAWTSATDPQAHLGELGLRTTDVLRLQGRWLAELGRDPALQARVCDEVRGWIEGLGWEVQGITESPITGPQGNVEFLISATRG